MSERTQLGMFGVPDRAVKVRRAMPAIPADVEKVLVALQVALPADHAFKRQLALAGFQPFDSALEGAAARGWTYWWLEWTT